MGCVYCPSGLGIGCQGPDGLDDLEAACDCECHEIDDLVAGLADEDEYEDDRVFYPQQVEKE